MTVRENRCTSGMPVPLYQRAAAQAEGLTALKLEAANVHAASRVTCQLGRCLFNVSTLPQPHASPHTSLFAPCLPHTPVFTTLYPFWVHNLIRAEEAGSCQGPQHICLFSPFASRPQRSLSALALSDFIPFSFSLFLPASPCLTCSFLLALYVYLMQSGLSSRLCFPIFE